MGVVLITGCSSGPGSVAASAEAGDRVCASMRTPSEQGALREACGATCDHVVPVGRSADPRRHDVVDVDGWIQGRFAMDDAGSAGLIRTAVGYR